MKPSNTPVLTHNSVHYLIAICSLLQNNGYARAVDIAKYLDITRGSVSITLRKLELKGYVNKDHNKFLSLTDQGKSVVNLVLSSRRLLVRFFKDVLKLSKDKAEAEACKIEHLLGKYTSQRLYTFLGLLLSEKSEAIQFREKLKQFELLCSKIETCDVCELECYFHHTENI